MDMRKYAGSRFLKLEDVIRRPRVEKILDVAEGKFGKPDIKFESGNQLSANATNVKALIKAYGDDDRDWIGCEVELYAGQTDYQGGKKDSILVRPISPTLSQETPAPAKAEPGLDDKAPW